MSCNSHVVCNVCKGLSAVAYRFVALVTHITSFVGKSLWRAFCIICACKPHRELACAVTCLHHFFDCLCALCFCLHTCHCTRLCCAAPQGLSSVCSHHIGILQAQ
jgi:hypothetical protein